MKLSDMLEILDDAMESTSCPAGVGKRYIDLMRRISVKKAYPRKAAKFINCSPRKGVILFNPISITSSLSDNDEEAFWSERPELNTNRVFLLK